MSPNLNVLTAFGFVQLDSKIAAEFFSHFKLQASLLTSRFCPLIPFETKVESTARRQTRRFWLQLVGLFTLTTASEHLAVDIDVFSVLQCCPRTQQINV